jgi:hypothetical protein
MNYRPNEFYDIAMQREIRRELLTCDPLGSSLVDVTVIFTGLSALLIFSVHRETIVSSPPAITEKKTLPTDDAEVIICLFFGVIK